MTIINSGAISDGLSAGGVTLANALTFAGGANSLTLSSGGTIGAITGGIAVSGALAIDPGVAGGINVYAVKRDQRCGRWRRQFDQDRCRRAHADRNEHLFRRDLRCRRRVSGQWRYY
jgi:hypothetical protein